ncbi:MAG: hypothetical protein ABII76_09540, partial [Pseudomonadota bacterium]
MPVSLESVPSLDAAKEAMRAAQARVRELEQAQNVAHKVLSDFDAEHHVLATSGPRRGKPKKLLPSSIRAQHDALRQPFVAARDALPGAQEAKFAASDVLRQAQRKAILANPDASPLARAAALVGYLYDAKEAVPAGVEETLARHAQALTRELHPGAAEPDIVRVAKMVESVAMIDAAEGRETTIKGLRAMMVMENRLQIQEPAPRAAPPEGQRWDLAYQPAPAPAAEAEAAAETPAEAAPPPGRPPVGEWTITERTGGVATAWQRDDVTITKETWKPGPGLAGTRYVVRGIGAVEFGAKSLESAQQYADKRIAVRQVLVDAVDDAAAVVTDAQDALQSARDDLADADPDDKPEYRKARDEAAVALREAKAELKAAKQARAAHDKNPLAAPPPEAAVAAEAEAAVAEREPAAAEVAAEPEGKYDAKGRYAHALDAEQDLQAAAGNEDAIRRVIARLPHQAWARAIRQAAVEMLSSFAPAPVAAPATPPVMAQSRAAIEGLHALAARAGEALYFTADDQLPPDLLAWVKAQKRPVEGFYDPADQRAYFLLHNIAGPARALEVWFHEVGWHHGLNILFPNDAELRDLLGLVADTLGLEGANRARLAEEHLARIAEKATKTVAERTLWERFKEWVRGLLHRLGMTTDLTPADLENLADNVIHYVMGDDAPRDLGLILTHSSGAEPAPEHYQAARELLASTAPAEDVEGDRQQPAPVTPADWRDRLLGKEFRQLFVQRQAAAKLRTKSLAKHPNPLVEQALQTARRRPHQPPLMERLRAAWEAMRGWRRTFAHLPETKEFAVYHEVLYQFKVQPAHTRFFTQRNLRHVIGDLTPAEYDLFSRRLEAEDQLAGREVGQPWRHRREKGPNGEDLSEAEALAQHHDSIRILEDAIAQHPKVQEAFQRRDALVHELLVNMVAAGIAEPQWLSNHTRWFHRMVFEHRALAELTLPEAVRAKARVPQLGGGLQRKRRGYERARVGDVTALGAEYDYSYDYLESEFAWMAEARMELEKARTLAVIGWLAGREPGTGPELPASIRELKLGHLLPKFKVQAARENYERVVGGPANLALLEAMRAQVAQLRATKPKGYTRQVKELRERIAQMDPTQPFRAKIAGMMAWLRDMAQKGGYDFGPLADALADDALAESEPDESPSPFARLLEYLCQRYPHEPPGIAAQAIYKAIAERGKLIRDTLGHDFQTWADVLARDPTLDAHYPQAGHMLYPALTISEQVMEQLQRGIITAEELPEKVRKVLAMGGVGEPIIAPREVVEQLDSMVRPARRDSTAQIAKWIWKSLLWTPLKLWLLFRPQNYLVYGTRNFGTDAEVSIAVSRKILTDYGQAATRDVLHLYYGDPNTLPADILEMLEDNVCDSGLTEAEFADFGAPRRFAEMRGETGLRKWADWLKWVIDQPFKAQRARECVLRVAAARYFRDTMNARGAIRDYGASDPAMIHQVRGIGGTRAASAKLARELIGDYQDISVAGETMSSYVAPFWRWQELQWTRTPRLFLNALRQGKGKGLAVGSVIVANALLKRMAFAIGLYLWNHLFHRREEDELTPRDQASSHVILGRRADGKPVFIRNIGAISDFAENFGGNTFMELLPKLRAGQLTPVDVAMEMGNDPLNRYVGVLNPYAKGFFEVATGQSLFPEPLHPRPAPRDELLAGAVALRDEYLWARSQFIKDGRRARPDYFARWIGNISYPKTNALNEAHALRNEFRKAIGEPQNVPPSLSATRDIKRAVE